MGSAKFCEYSDSESNDPVSIPAMLNMNDLALLLPPIAAAGYSLVYLIFGGGLGGAIIIFIIAKMLGK